MLHQPSVSTEPKAESPEPKSTALDLYPGEDHAWVEKISWAREQSQNVSCHSKVATRSSGAII
jgi:hypothetical protein